MMSPGLGEAPAGPEATTLYCKPSGRLTTPAALAFRARKSALVDAAGAAGAGWA